MLVIIWLLLTYWINLMIEEGWLNKITFGFHSVLLINHSTVLWLIQLLPFINSLRISIFYTIFYWWCLLESQCCLISKSIFIIFYSYFLNSFSSYLFCSVSILLNIRLSITSFAMHCSSSPRTREGLGMSKNKFYLVWEDLSIESWLLLLLFTLY